MDLIFDLMSSLNYSPYQKKGNKMCNKDCSGNPYIDFDYIRVTKLPDNEFRICTLKKDRSGPVGKGPHIHPSQINKLLQSINILKQEV